MAQEPVSLKSCLFYGPSQFSHNLFPIEEIDGASVDGLQTSQFAQHNFYPIEEINGATVEFMS